MPDNIIKASINADLSKETVETISKQTEFGVSEGFKSAANKKFDWSNVKKDLTDSVKMSFDAIWKSNGKAQIAQNKASEAYKKSQATVAELVKKQGSGFGNSLKLVSAIGKQGVAGMQGMLANVNPYVAAIKIAAEAVKFMADQFERIAKESAKFVGQGSIFTNKETMQMMQMTGQTATQAQGTQRSLTMLGMDFSDIQSGKITAEQAALFEELRLRELEKLEEINKVAGPMFKSMQQVTLGISLLMQDIDDWITKAFANTRGIETLIGSIKTFMSRIGPFMKSLIDMVAPLIGIVSDVISLVMNFVSALLPIITGIFDALAPVFEIISKITNIITRVLSPIMLVIGDILGVIGSALERLFTTVLNPLVELLDLIMEPLNKFGAWIEKTLGIKNVPDTVSNGIGSGISNVSSTYQNQTTNNYIYGSQSLNNVNPRQNTNDLFANSYVLVND